MIKKKNQDLKKYPRSQEKKIQEKKIQEKFHRI